MSIHEMFEEPESEILAFVPDYKINLIAPAMIEDADFGKFQTTLREVLLFIKYSNDGKKLTEAVNSNKNFQSLGRKEVEVLNACVNANLSIENGEEVLDVCQAIQMIAENAKEEGIKEGIKEGQVSALLQSVKNLTQNMEMTTEQAMNVLGISDSDRKKLSTLL